MAVAQKFDQLMESMDTRDLIGQAKGILVERCQIDALKAFALLIRTSQHPNTKLRDVALALARTGELARFPDKLSPAHA